VLWEDGKRALALRWAGAEPGTAGYLGSLAVDRASNWTAFEAAMPRWKLPPENIVYADADGNVGEHSIGLAPLRKNWSGLLPMPGNGGYEWSGFIPASELPHSFNPAFGFIATANHNIIPRDFPYKIGFEWAPPFRFQRITQVLQRARQKGEKLGIDEMEQLQNDIVSLPALELIRLLRSAVGTTPDAAEQLMLGWDGLVRQTSAPAALYELWLQELTSAVSHRAAPESVWKLVDNWSPVQVLAYLSHPTTAIFSVNPDAERNRVLRETLNSAAERLSKLEGPDPAKWTWGELHVVRFRHPLDQLPGAARLMDLGPIPRPGDEYTVDATGVSDTSYEQVSGASYREILDTGNWDNSVAINAPGQSGQPGSPHYSDLLRMWSEGAYFPLLYSRQAVEKGTTDKLELVPGG